MPLIQAHQKMRHLSIGSSNSDSLADLRNIFGEKVALVRHNQSM